MPKTAFFLIFLPLLNATIGWGLAISKGKVNGVLKENAAENAIGNANAVDGANANGYDGFHHEEAARDKNGAEGTEFVQEADHEVDQEESSAESPDERGQPKENEPMSGMGQRKGQQLLGGEEDYADHVHPHEHEAVDGKIPGVKHFRPVEETGDFNVEELAEPAENARPEDEGENGQSNQQDGEGEEKQQGEEREGKEEEDKGPQIGAKKEQKSPLDGPMESEDANAQNAGDGENLDGHGENGKENGEKKAGENEENAGENGGEKEGEQQNAEEEDDEEKAKFLRIYPFLKDASADAVSAFRALLRDQHLSKAEVEQKRKEWANEQLEEVKNGFFAWKERLDAKKQKAMNKIEKKMATFRDETKQLYLEVKAVIADQAISRHQECQQIRSLVNGADEALRADFLQKIKLRLIKFCLEEEEQQVVEEAMPPGPGNAAVGEEKNMNDGLPLSDGTDDLEQNHPPQPHSMVGEDGAMELGRQQQQQFEPLNEGQLPPQNLPMNDQMNNGQQPGEMNMEYPREQNEDDEGNAEPRMGENDDKFEEKFPRDKFPMKAEAYGKEEAVGQGPVKKKAAQIWNEV